MSKIAIRERTIPLGNFNVLAGVGIFYIQDDKESGIKFEKGRYGKISGSSWVVSGYAPLVGREVRAAMEKAKSSREAAEAVEVTGFWISLVFGSSIHRGGAEGAEGKGEDAVLW